MPVIGVASFTSVTAFALAVTVSPAAATKLPKKVNKNSAATATANEITCFFMSDNSTRGTISPPNLSLDGFASKKLTYTFYPILPGSRRFIIVSKRARPPSSGLIMRTSVELVPR